MVVMDQTPQKSRGKGLQRVAMADYGKLRGQAAAGDGLRVMTHEGPLGSVRLTVRAIAQAEGYVFCRHGMLRPFAVTEKEWAALPPATDLNFDV